MRFRFLRIILLGIIFFAPFIINYADRLYSLSRASSIRNYEVKSLLVLATIGIGIALCAKIAASGKKSNQENIMPVYIIDPRYTPPGNIHLQRRYPQ